MPPDHAIRLLVLADVGPTQAALTMQSLMMAISFALVVLNQCIHAICMKIMCLPYGLVVRIRRSHRRGPGSIPGVGTFLFFLHFPT